VHNGHVTLTGVVANDLQRVLPQSLASQFLAFTVTIEPRTNTEANAAGAAVSTAGSQQRS